MSKLDPTLSIPFFPIVFVVKSRDQITAPVSAMQKYACLVITLMISSSSTGLSNKLC